MGLFDNSSISFPKRQIEKTDSSDSESSEPSKISYETYYKAYKQCPEFTAVINSIANDMFAEGGTLISLDDNQSKVKKMNNHLLKINFEKKLKSWAIHGFLTGDGYLEYHDMNKDTIKSLVKSLISETNKTINKSMNEKDIEKSADYYIEKKSEDLIMSYPFNIYPMKTTGTEKVVDGSGDFAGLIQEVNTKKITFTEKEIINWMPIDLNEIYGFTPAQACTDDIATLLFAKQYAGKYFENGGTPNIIFILEKARGGDRNYEVAKSEIKAARNKSQWQKNLVLAGGGGGITIEKLNDFKKDMEFLSLINMCVRNIAMSFGVPPSKVPYKMESKGDLREFNEGYWKTISDHQTNMELLLNRVIFNKYNMKWTFNRTYKIDELREANIASLMVDRDIINLDEAREMIGKYTTPEDLKTKWNIKLKMLKNSSEQKPNDIPHRDPGKKQDARGKGEDKGAKFLPPISG
jgi:HK97 family phage portal protein